ncbi:MAG TPA: DnaJ domain-containing protein [Acidobacteriota bacterium]|nr:DnaJ domain-containing protein [Acidobacteriota bacterium]
MNTGSFVDYYDLMQISPNADEDTIQHVFRYLAKKWHPDYPQGDPDRFKRLVEAHKVLTNVERRAAYDKRYQRFWEAKWNLAAEAGDGRGFPDDSTVRESLLSLYYVQRRNKMNDPGLGEMEVARLMRIPIHLIEFHIWYLKEKGCIARLENGQFALTAAGVDQVEKSGLHLSQDRLLKAGNGNSENPEENKGPEGKTLKYLS